jgi:hypothetical protein
MQQGTCLKYTRKNSRTKLALNCLFTTRPEKKTNQTKQMHKGLKLRKVAFQKMKYSLKEPIRKK